MIKSQFAYQVGRIPCCWQKCMQQLHKYSNIPFDVEYLVLDPGYNELNRQKIIENAEFLNIPITMFNAEIFNYVATLDKSPCYICARMRRGYLYSHAQELGCNKIALGHHFDDVIETVLMSMLYNGTFRTMMPKLRSINWKGMELIRPMYMIKEADILAWKRYNSLQFIQCACRLTENCVLDDTGMGSKRQEMKTLIKKFRQIDPNMDRNIFNSIHDINLDTIIGYHSKERKVSFAESYLNAIDGE